LRRIIVKVRDGGYPIYIGSGILEKFPAVCEKHGIRSHVVIITDRIVAGIYLDGLVGIMRDAGFRPDVIIIPPGESQKSISRVARIYTELIKMKLRRDETIIALGGGVIGDLAGFVAATYLRGVNLVYVPTTLLAQVDSSIGGKVAINHKFGKNLIGAFYRPVFIFSDIETLKTLPRRELICGLGEVVKYGIIMKKDILDIIEDRDVPSGDNLKIYRKLVEHSANVKSYVVSRDERERKYRMILNFGHTIGHGIEASLNYKKLKHGEAILIGILAESFISVKRGVLPKVDFERIKKIILKISKEIPHKEFDKNSILKHIYLDKKIMNQRLNMFLPVRIGMMRFFDDISFRELSMAIDYIKEVFF
jgi:3-dehydroquinate synthase